MDKIIIDGIDILNPIEDKMDKIIEAFVDYYGEKYRPRIEEKLKSAKIFFVAQNIENDKMKTSIEKYYNKKADNLEIEFWEEVIGEKGATKVKEKSLLRIADKLESLDIYLPAIEPPTYFVEFLKIFGYSFPSDLRKTRLKEIEMLKDKNFREQILKKFKKFRVIWETKYRDRYNSIIKERDEKIKQVYSELEYIDRLKENYSNQIVNLFDKNVAGYVIDFDSMAQFKKNELYQTFNDLMARKRFVTNYDKERFVKLFKTFGIEHNSYEEYMADDEIKIIFNEQLYNEYDELVEKHLEAKVINNPFIQKIRYELESEGKVYGINELLNIVNYFIQSPEKMGGLVISRKIDDKVKQICILPQGLELCDNVLFHEFNHILESDISNDLTKDISGLNIYEINDTDSIYDVKKVINPDNDEDKIGYKYQLLNEVVNDYFSTQVTNNSINRNGYICNGGNIDSFYSEGFPLLKDLIEENKDILIKSVLTEDHQYFARMIGQENFDKLADCVTEFLYFNDFQRREIYKSIVRKTGIKVIDEFVDCYKFDCKWDEREQVIVDAFKTVKEIRNLAKAKREEKHEEQENVEQENVEQENEENENQ